MMVLQKGDGGVGEELGYDPGKPLVFCQGESAHHYRRTGAATRKRCH